MATLDNERYLRHVWLLGEGGLFVLRSVVKREVTNSGSTLDILLQNSRSKFHGILREQRDHLFPSSTTVNACIDTWDMSILFLVLKRMFWSTISLTEKASINTLKTYRNDIQGHPTTMSMSSSDYYNNRLMLEQDLRRISSGISANVEIEDIISRTASYNINVQSVFLYMKEIGDFKTSVLCAIEEMLHHQKTQMEGMIGELSREIRAFTHMFMQNRKQECTRELVTILQAECENEEKQKKAIDLLFDFVKTIQNENTFTEEEIRDNIRKRIEWYGCVSLDLIDDVIKWFCDINRLTDTILGYPGKRCIRIPIFCSSVTGLLNLLTYINGDEGKRRLSRTSSSISKLLGFSCSLSWSVKPSDLQKTMSLFCLRCQSPEKEKIKSENTQSSDKEASVETSSDGAIKYPNEGGLAVTHGEVNPLLSIGTYTSLTTEENYFTHQLQEPRRADRIRIDVEPNGDILVVCFIDKTLYKLDHKFHLVAESLLPGHPNDVCYIGKGKAAVCLDYSRVVIVDVTRRHLIAGFIDIEESCSCIACYNNLLYICDCKGCVFTCTIDLNPVKRLLYRSKNCMTSQPGSIAISEDGQMIYIKFGPVLETIDNSGNQVSLMRTGENKSFSPICIIGDGTILTSGLFSTTLKQIRYDGKQVLKEIPIFSTPKLISSMCYDKVNSRLLIAECLQQLHAFKLLV